MTFLMGIIIKNSGEELEKLDYGEESSNLKGESERVTQEDYKVEEG